ncbi:hypothetical protein [Tabrizicola flagellatus]|uniref:hypothetical protein n=1 Tax=Tabrizicola flagellatus TaxID=2593021 RepID=UPI00190F7405|nr:hypothetical protein [Tabrizicola flagellatus]
MTVEDRLAALAAAGQTITYGELARDLGLRMAELTARLEALMEEDAAAGRPFRAALLRQRLSPDHLPAPGFFLKAAALGRPASDPQSFTLAERHALHLSANIPG